MSEKIIVKELFPEIGAKSLLACAILHCCNDEVIEAMRATSKSDPYLIIDFSIHGIEVSFSSFMKDVENQMSDMIKNAAMDIIKEQLFDLREKLFEAGEQIEESVFQFCRDKGINVEKEEH